MYDNSDDLKKDTERISRKHKNDADTLMQRAGEVSELLSEKGLKICTVESCTGGLVATHFTGIYIFTTANSCMDQLFTSPLILFFLYLFYL